MRFCDFPEANHHMGAPKGWDPETQGECGVLPVQVTEDGRCISIWMPDPEERAKIARGHPIALSIVGGQPPVLLSVSEGHLIAGVDDHGRENRAGYGLAKRRIRAEVEEMLAKTGTGSLTREQLMSILGDAAALN